VTQASVLTDSGATCVCNSLEDPTCLKDEAYALCLVEVNRDFITATAAIAALGSFLMGISANLPVAVAPAMGLNAYLAYQMVGFHGTGPIDYRVAMTAVFVEGFIFVALSLLGIRQWLARIIPASIKVACGAGIGLFLTLIGLSYSAGLGAITGAQATPLELGGCPPQYRDELTGMCTSHKATNPTMWLGFLVGGVFTALLMTYKVRGSMIVGIALVSIFSWPRDTSITYFPRTVIGDSRFEFFKNVVAFHPIKQTLLAQDWDLTKVGGQFVLAVFTMLYVDILDATGTLYSMARFSGVVDPVTGDFPKSTIAYSADAIAISIGSLFGSSPVTAFVESGVSKLQPIEKHSLTCIPGWYSRGWPYGPYCHYHWLAILRLPLLRTHLRIDPAMGNRWCAHPCRLHDDAWCSRHQLELSRRQHSRIRHAHVHALFILDRVRSHRRYHVLRHHQQHYMGCWIYFPWQDLPS
jgi:AGZA family xanthine/uracil permease-like MFS transporter